MEPGEVPDDGGDEVGADAGPLGGVVPQAQLLQQQVEEGVVAREGNDAAADDHLPAAHPVLRHCTPSSNIFIWIANINDVLLSLSKIFMFDAYDVVIMAQIIENNHIEVEVKSSVSVEQCVPQNVGCVRDPEK